MELISPNKIIEIKSLHKYPKETINKDTAIKIDNNLTKKPKLYFLAR